jgi:hypothetical protein
MPLRPLTSSELTPPEEILVHQCLQRLPLYRGEGWCTWPGPPLSRAVLRSYCSTVRPCMPGGANRSPLARSPHVDACGLLPVIIQLSKPCLKDKLAGCLGGGEMRVPVTGTLTSMASKSAVQTTRS